MVRPTTDVELRAVQKRINLRRRKAVQSGAERFTANVDSAFNQKLSNVGRMFVDFLTLQNLTNVSIKKSSYY